MSKIRLVYVEVEPVYRHLNSIYQLGSENDKYTTWCPHEENHLPVIMEAANACIAFEVIIHHHP